MLPYRGCVYDAQITVALDPKRGRLAAVKIRLEGQRGHCIVVQNAVDLDVVRAGDCFKAEHAVIASVLIRADANRLTCRGFGALAVFDVIVHLKYAARLDKDFTLILLDLLLVLLKLLLNRPFARICREEPHLVIVLVVKTRYRCNRVAAVSVFFVARGYDMIPAVREGVLLLAGKVILELDCELKLAEPAVHINQKSELRVYRVNRAVKAVDIDDFVCNHISQVRRPV